MKGINVSQVILFHQKIISRTGGSDGIRDISLIESALNRAFATFDGKELYEDDLVKISVITYGLINNHGFVDGNKRIGIAVMLFLLKINFINVKYSQKELVELGLKVATGEYKEKEIEDWIIGHQLD
ncbi:death-on-curing protein [Vulcanibacillus modesticaldus]|uniref:Death-on-curing protein n=1 Tax=Vulcanibacillus modesticaldus TaxID=337097 RepID=A0A1D2YS70_9BACI|nr:type II toxin-antitoxin system death-on-curing family toxin [Vulcanibacillus modesticaldus]OEF96660.1 death-on-curing protein [Vulcanibacillus modesticaldus]